MFPSCPFSHYVCSNISASRGLHDGDLGNSVLSNRYSVHGLSDTVYCLCCTHPIRWIKAFHPNIRWMPESARWLIANGKLEKAQTYLKICAKINRAEGFSEALKTEVSLFQIINTKQR